MTVIGYIRSKGRKVWRQTAMAVGFVAITTLGYLSMSIATSCPVQAQSCGCGVCVAVAPGAAGMFADVGVQTGLQIGAATSIITAQYTLAASAFALQATARFGQIVLDIDDWFDTFWYYNERPSMQAQVEQQNVMDTIQAVTLSTFRDSAEQARTSQLLSELQVESALAYQPSEQVCAAGTIAGGLTRANTIARAYARAAPVESAGRSAGTRGTSGERGAANDISERWNNVKASYCNASENGGASGCASDGTMVNADIDVTGTVFQKDTIDLTDPATKASVDDLIDNIAEPFVPNNIPASTLNSATGKEDMIKRDEYRAQRQVIHAALEYVVSRRAPSGIDGQFVNNMRGAAGISADMFSESPSHNEIMDVMMNERFRTGQYSVEQVDTPENNAREATVQNAFEAVQGKDLLDLTDHLSLLLAAQTGIEAREMRGGGVQ